MARAACVHGGQVELHRDSSFRRSANLPRSRANSAKTGVLTTPHLLPSGRQTPKRGSNFCHCCAVSKVGESMYDPRIAYGKSSWIPFSEWFQAQVPGSAVPGQANNVAQTSHLVPHVPGLHLHAWTCTHLPVKVRLSLDTLLAMEGVWGLDTC